MPMQCGEVLSFRSYGPAGHSHSHEHLQLVLPLRGSLALEVDGRGGRLDALHGALIVPGAAHVQAGDGLNRLLVVDCDSALLESSQLDQARTRPFLGISVAARSLLAFVDINAGDNDAVAAPVARHVLPLLLHGLFDALPRSARGGAGLRRLCEQIRAAPGQDWSRARLAPIAGLGVSTMHGAFKRQFGLTPGQWLQQQRLQWAQCRLVEGRQPVAQIAQQAGFSDQSALTRAMRRSQGITPGRYRR
ncbi:MAG: AraC family transcriptional regulator, partial [Stenotrophomonas sp.]